MWLLLRALKLHPLAALLGTLSFMFCASMVNWIIWNNSNPLSLLPWLVWEIHAWIVGRPGRPARCQPALISSANDDCVP